MRWWCNLLDIVLLLDTIVLFFFFFFHLIRVFNSELAVRLCFFAV